MPTLDAERIRSAVTDRVIGGIVEVRGSVGSTMDEVAEAARGGAQDGYVLLADHQSSGRGRLNRRWQTPPGQAIAMSVLLRPRKASPELVARIPMIVGLSVLDALDPVLPGRCALKWPNDVQIDDFKVAGLLVEVAWGRPPHPDSSTSDSAATVIVGLGMNVLQAESELPPGATSVAARRVAGPSASRTDLVISILTALDARYQSLLSGNDPLPDWRDRLATIGRDVEARLGIGVEAPFGVGDDAHPRALKGLAVGVTDLGALRIRLESGEEAIVFAGDVTLAPRSTRIGA